MSTDLGYIVIEFNQASGQPTLVGQDFHDEREDAEDQAVRLHGYARSVGRRETYAVATVTLEDE